jgi:hypothetical protein
VSAEDEQRAIDTFIAAVNAARAAKGVTKERPAPLVNDVLAILTGHLGTPKSQAERLTETFLGVAIGSMTDLGKTDEYILQTCKSTLARIRAALVNPDIVRDALALSERAK